MDEDVENEMLLMRIEELERQLGESEAQRQDQAEVMLRMARRLDELERQHPPSQYRSGDTSLSVAWSGSSHAFWGDPRAVIGEIAKEAEQFTANGPFTAPGSAHDHPNAIEITHQQGESANDDQNGS